MRCILSVLATAVALAVSCGNDDDATPGGGGSAGEGNASAAGGADSSAAGVPASAGMQPISGAGRAGGVGGAEAAAGSGGSDAGSLIEIDETDGIRRYADDTVARSCREYRHPAVPTAYVEATSDGVYEVDPDGPAGDPPFPVRCDMTREGGGWTLVAQGRPAAAATPTLCTTAAAGDLATDLQSDDQVGGSAKLADTTIELLWSGGARELLLLGDVSIDEPPAASWDSSCVLDFVDTQEFEAGEGYVEFTLETAPICSTKSFELDDIIQVPTATSFACGFALQTSDETTAWIWSAQEGYGAGSCSPADSGRTWPGITPNYGCAVSRVFVR